jgi:hypothetical protein
LEIIRPVTFNWTALLIIASKILKEMSGAILRNIGIFEFGDLELNIPFFTAFITFSKSSLL